MRSALDLFEQALDWSPQSIQERLATIAVNDPELAKEARRLLHVHHGANAVMPTNFSPVEMLLPRRPPPATIGHYVLRECLGAGRMGEVYRAERNDGLFEQIVAIKLLRTEVDGEAARRSFDTERRLRLPHIGLIYDGGATADGRPLFGDGVRSGAACQ